MGNHLPEEIIADIISRSTVDTILERKLVCKTWRTLISHPSFAQLHLRRSLQLLDDNDDEVVYRNPCGVTADAAAKVSFISQIEFLGGKRESHLYYGEYNVDESDSSKKLKHIKINHPPFDFNTLTLHSSCNGLICLTRKHNVENNVYICNPVTREYINLPRLVIETPLNKRGCISDGFGYSPKTNEYKFVRIYHKDRDESYVGQVYVYTLGSGCGWRNIGEINYDCSYHSGVLANGALYWVDFKDGKIVSFDLADEEFRLLPSPPFFDKDYYYYYAVQVWAGRVCAVFQNVYDGYLEVWSVKLKKEKEEKGSNYDMKDWTWSLEFKTLYVWHNFTPVFITKSGEDEVLLLDDEHRFCRQNLKNFSVETLVDYDPGSEISATILHMNSFVSLKALGEDAKIFGSAEGVKEQLSN